MQQIINRRKSHQVKIGGLIMGSDYPVIVQSMTNTETKDVKATVAQVKQLSDAGSEIIRLTINDSSAAKALPEIKNELIKAGYEVPLVGDFHYNGHRLLDEVADLGPALAKYRINPGNVGFKNKRDENFELIINHAIKNNAAVRIGVNWGSLDQELLKKMMDDNLLLEKPLDNSLVMRKALIESALSSSRYAEEIGLAADKIVVSCKTSRVQDLIAVYQALAEQCQYPLHLGLTEAGIGDKGIVASSAALAILLNQGIGDTIRVSITPKPSEARTKEVKICQEILQSLEIRSFRPAITSCPGCGRTTSTYFQQLALDIQDFIDENMPIWRKKYPKAAGVEIAVMGCIVNGPGESKHANIGISLPGSGEKAACPVFVDGKRIALLSGDTIKSDFKKIVLDYIKASMN
jgi:(E)-4-hydroxy-3-methylbut-2-enyl-diphosphate synthase